MTYHEHYFRLFREINRLPKCGFLGRWREADEEFHRKHHVIIGVCIIAGYVQICMLTNRIRITRKGRKLK